MPQKVTCDVPNYYNPQRIYDKDKTCFQINSKQVEECNKAAQLIWKDGHQHIVACHLTAGGCSSKSTWKCSKNN